MMIVQGVFTVEPAEREAFLAQSFETMRISRSEKGCIEYVMAPDPIDDTRVVLSERWESKEDLDAHIAALMERRKEPAAADAPAPIVPSGRDVTFFNATAVEQ